MAKALAASIEADLRRCGSRARAIGAKAYLKSDLVHVGMTVPDLARAPHLARR
jgi:hypothetical protein